MNPEDANSSHWWEETPEACCGRRRRRRGWGAPCRRLTVCGAEERCIVRSNPDRRSLEMGLFRGALVKVLRNRPEDTNMLIGVGDSRFVLSKQTADLILVD
jgi:Fe2+ transport system protein FeoA